MKSWKAKRRATLAYLIPLFAIAVVLNACSVSAPVYAVAEGGGDTITLTGTATGYADRTGTIRMTSEQGFMCAGEFRYTGARTGVADLTCSNGETATARFNALTNRSGYGYGVTDTGRRISFTYGLGPDERAKYLPTADNNPFE